MLQFLRSILSPMISLFILTLGHGFLLTLVPIRASLEDFSSDIIGYLASAFFLGVLIGALKINKIIEGVGHIRAFAFFASIISAITLLQGMFVYPIAWIVFRFLFGLAIAGIFITIESWLLVKSSLKMRGVALSIYMTIFYASQSLGQLFLGLFDPNSLYPFCFIVLLTSISLLPLTITKAKAPIIEEHSVLSPWKLFKISPLALITALFAGFILGPIYGLYAIYAKQLSYSLDHISWIMAGVIFGGLVFQWPIGAVSDRVDRRKVILFSSVVISVLSLVICFYSQMSFVPFLVFSILFGGFCFVLYPLSISHACDLVDSKDIVSTTGAILLCYGAGSIIGPIATSYAMQYFGSVAFFYSILVYSAVLSLICLRRIFIKVPVPKDEKLHYSNMPRTTPLASELDPRIEEGSEKEKE